jgi:hypothetical protein
LSRQFIATVLIATPTPMSFWRNAQALYHAPTRRSTRRRRCPVEMSAIDARFKAMLALTAAQPEGLAPREIAFLAEYLETHATAPGSTSIRPEAPATGSGSTPISISRR